MSFTIFESGGFYYVMQDTTIVFYGDIQPSSEQALIRLNQYKGSK